MSFFEKKIILKFFVSLLFCLSVNSIKSQCFEIESILVDACGSPEGENEMLRFKVGPNPLNANNLSATWASANAWLGICQNTASINATSNLNNTITGCGLLIEPAGGILPANSNVLLITSTAIDATANSFANLNDTLHVIYQCAGNTGGHFGNYSPNFLLRTVSLSFSSPSGCSDLVTYNKSLLLNQNLQSGGTSAIKNGGLVNFDAAGNDTYYNNGCQAPFNPTEITALNLTPLTICPGDDIDLNAITKGAIQTIFWVGNNGSFTNPNNPITTYNSSINDISPFYLIVGGINSCNDTIFDSLLVNINPPSNVSILGPDTITICQGQSVTLGATGSNPFLWSTGESTDSIVVNLAGEYYLSSSSNCPSNIDTVNVVFSQSLNISILEPNSSICSNETITIHANGASLYIWNTGATSGSITVNSSGNYSVTSNGNCPSNSASIQITVIPQITIDIKEGSSIILCPNSTTNLNASASNNYLWNTGENSSSININSIGTYYVETTNGNCPSGYDSINVISDTTPEAKIIGDSTICDDYGIYLYAEGSGNFNWSNGDEGNSTQVETEGIITLTATNICNEISKDSLQVVSKNCSTNVYIPNSFTPNGDNMNDYFKVEGTNIQSINGKIFNRWGELLYESNNLNSSWDGTYKGKELPSEVYVYNIKLEFLNGDFKTFMGKLSLLK